MLIYTLAFHLYTNQNLWIVKYSIDAAGFLILDTQSFILKRQANCKVISVLLDKHSSVEDDVALRHTISVRKLCAQLWIIAQGKQFCSWLIMTRVSIRSKFSYCQALGFWSLNLRLFQCKRNLCIYVATSILFVLNFGLGLESVQKLCYLLSSELISNEIWNNSHLKLLNADSVKFIDVSIVKSLPKNVVLFDWIVSYC